MNFYLVPHVEYAISAAMNVPLNPGDNNNTNFDYLLKYNCRPHLIVVLFWNFSSNIYN